MGGTVAVSIRRENGDVVKMARRTGSYGSMLTSQEFLSGQTDLAVDNYIQIFNEMKEDYQSGAPYKHPMSPCYGGFESLAPTGYGLVVIDIQNKKIHSMQSYDRPGSLHGMTFSDFCVYDKDYEQALDLLLSKNQLVVYDKKSFLGSVQDVLGADITTSKIGALIKKSFRDEPSGSELYKDISSLDYWPAVLEGYEKLFYKETMQDLIVFAKNLKNDGFMLSSEEKEIWKEHAQYFLEDLEDDQKSDPSQLLSELDRALERVTKKPT